MLMSPTYNGRSPIPSLAAARGSLRSWLAAGCAVLVLGGCERAGIEEHTIPKGVEHVPAASEPVSGSGPVAPTHASPPPASDPSRAWTVPAGWTEDPKPRQMRLATYIAPDPAGPVEIAVTRFGGRVGGELANVNRWRGQLGLPPIREAELDQTVVRFSADGYAGYETRIETPSGVMLAAGVYEEAGDQTWFVRATVADAKVADRLKADLFGMARSIAGLGAEGGK